MKQIGPADTIKPIDKVKKAIAADGLAPAKFSLCGIIVMKNHELEKV